MRIYISVDMEGISGVASANHVSANHPDYNRFRKLMTADVNAAIEGAMEAGATEFVVNDAHGNMNNVLVEELHPAARLISGSNKRLGQMQGIDDSFAGVFLIGFHAREGGGDGFLNHTLVGGHVARIRCNGMEHGEVGLNGLIAGHFGVPLLLVTGDDELEREVSATFGDAVSVVTVKKSLDRFTAKCIAPSVARAMIKDAAKKAVKSIDPARATAVEGPVRLEVTFKSTAEAAICCWFPAVERVDSKTIAVTGPDFPTAYGQMRACLILGRTAVGGVNK